MKKTKLIAVLLVCVQLLALSAGAIENIDINAGAAILIDASDGHEIYSKNADTPLPPASITKLMTALLVVENVSDLSEVITANESAFEGLSAAGSTVGIKAGEQMSIDNLLICLLVASANEAANILAERVSGNVPAFVELMNARALELGLENTHFANTSGLHDDSHKTSARDVAKIALEVRKHARLREICAMKDGRIPPTNLSKERYFFTTNSLISRYKEIGYEYAYATGMKTGHTSNAGYCLAASAEKNGTELISVVLGAKIDEKTNKKGSFVESKKLLMWGFENFKKATLLSASTAVSEVHVESAKDRDHVVVHIENDYSVLMPKDFDSSKITLVKTTPDSIEAPVTKGDAIGTVLIQYDGKDYAELPLVAADDVERSIILYLINRVKTFIKSPVAIIILIALVLLVIGYIIYVIRYNKRKRNRRRRRRYY